MIDAPNIFLAFTAGLVSFLSPCCLPLVPGYLAAVSGTDRPPGAQGVDRQVLIRSLVFVGTFSLIFILFGLTATALGSLLFDSQPMLNKVAGIAIIGLGVLFLASLFVPKLNREWRPDALIEKAGTGGPVVAGAAFAIAWTPCVGPTLGAILGLAATTSGTAQGGLLLAVYSAGLAVPFMLTAVAFNRATTAFRWLRDRWTVVTAISGVVLIAMGLLLLTGELTRLNNEAQQGLDSIGLNVFKSL